MIELCGVEQMDTYQYQYGDRPLDGYTIQRAAGRGGFGEVYYAISDSGRQVALKAIQRAEQIELRGISQCMNLKSPHLVTVFDVKYNDQGRPFVIMEYVSGPSLRDLLKESPDGLGAQKAAFFLREIAKGLSFLHDCGIVHRDLKPGNIFYENGCVKIGDYGLAKAFTEGQDVTHTSTVGTVHYMAPELGTGHYDRTIDIYALGVVLYEMLTGRLPFPGSDDAEVFRQHVSALPPLDGIEEPFARAIRRAMAKDPHDRYSTVQAMVEDVLDAGRVGEGASQLAPEALSIAAARCEPRVRKASPPTGKRQGGDDQAVRQESPGEKVAGRARVRWLRRFVVAAVAAVTLATGGYLVGPAHRQHRIETLQADITLAKEAADAGNMKLVLDLIEKHPHTPELAGLRLVAFAKLQSAYGTILGTESDRRLNRLINRRMQASGVLMWDLSPHKDGRHLWSCVQIGQPDGDYRYLQLFFPEAVGTLDQLEKEGLVKGAQVQMYGFFTRVDKRLLSKDQYGLQPVEAWTVMSAE